MSGWFDCWLATRSVSRHRCFHQGFAAEPTVSKKVENHNNMWFTQKMTHFNWKRQKLIKAHWWLASSKLLMKSLWQIIPLCALLGTQPPGRTDNVWQLESGIANMCMQQICPVLQMTWLAALLFDTVQYEAVSLYMYPEFLHARYRECSNVI